ncbi:MAG: hypothetical protein ABL925_02580 [Methylococcales bacterium]
MFKIPFDTHKPIVGKASVIINKPAADVFHFIGAQFFENYPKWAADIIEFEPLDGKEAYVGAKARQIRIDQGKPLTSLFVISAYQPVNYVCFKGINADYEDKFVFETGSGEHSTKLTYSFELLNVELFMRPFEKLIRLAIEDGAETTTENIKNLLSDQES